MKSKSFNYDHTSTESKQNRRFDFVNLYKNVAETSTPISEKYKSKTSDGNGSGDNRLKSESPKREKSSHKRKKEKREAIDISQINIEGPTPNRNLSGSTPVNEFKATSPLIGNCNAHCSTSKVKSIMKNPAAVTEFRDDAMDGSKLDGSKSKKRNKSVSFMLEDTEEVVIKKTKSGDWTSETKSDPGSSKIKINKVKKILVKVKKSRKVENENKVDLNQNMDTDDSVKEKINTKKSKIKLENQTALEIQPVHNDIQSDNVIERKKKRKRANKLKKPDESTEIKDSTFINNEAPEKPYKTKKKKHLVKPEQDNDEPASKTRKKDSKPDVIKELENLSIGDNPHTLTNLLDEMTVVDKDKRKKLKQQFNNNKTHKGVPKTTNSEKTEEVQEKVKWRRRKWNKDTKADAKDISLETAIIVENLPLSLLFSYKKVLAEHFVKYGLIKTVGIAEVYSTEVSKPGFTTTINFYSDGAATQALQEDSTILEGSCIQVKRPLPPTETTLVLRSYGALTPQCISSVFSGVGRIRNIHQSVKGKHAMATCFIEFDGPESVERAIKLSANVKIDGKKMYLSKYEVRAKKTKQEKTIDNQGSDADQSEGSQD